jgi:mannosidase alpha-like ER degradation enhancer 2
VIRNQIVESACTLHHFTRDARSQEMARTILDDLARHRRTADGYTILESVVTKAKGDRMHSFFLAETLKYLYLLFAPDALDFDAVVFNTEARPLRRTW